jgi:membrane protease YdiL (CAAX protease family)
VILGCVALLVLRDRWTPGLRQVARPTSSPAARVAEVKSTQLQMISRAAVGAKVLLPPEQAGALGPLVGNVEQAVKTPLDELRAIPVIGELRGTAAALDKLGQWSLKHRNQWNVDPPTQLYPDAEALRKLYAQGVDRLSREESDYLTARHGWFARLALAHDLPDDNPRRADAIDPARRAIVAILALVVGGVVALLVGVVLAIVAIVWFANGRFVRRYRPAAVFDHAGPFVEAFALYLAAFIGLSLALGLLFPGAAFWPNWTITVVVPLAFAWLRVRGVPSPEIRHGLGWHGGRGVLRELAAGVAGYLAGLPVIAVGMIVTLILVQVTGKQPGHPVQDMPLDAPLDRVQVFILAAVWAPLVEETMFRGALFHHLRARFRWWASTVVVSLIFAAIHPQGLATIPALTAVAFVLAGIREWRDSIVAPMAAHALHNGVLITVLIATMS